MSQVEEAWGNGKTWAGGSYWNHDVVRLFYISVDCILTHNNAVRKVAYKRKVTKYG